MKKNVIIVLLIILCVISVMMNLYLIKNDKCDKKQKEPFKIKNLLVGDCTTFRYNINTYFKGINIVKSANCGFTSKDIIDNYDSMILSYKPKMIILLIGTNDIENGVPNEEILDNIDKIVKKTRKNNISIMIESIYPIIENRKKINKKNRTNNKIKDMNSLLKEYCADNDIEYIDIYTKLIDDDGNLKDDYSSETNEINDGAYEVVTLELMKYIY